MEALSNQETENFFVDVKLDTQGSFQLKKKDSDEYLKFTTITGTAVGLKERKTASRQSGKELVFFVLKIRKSGKNYFLSGYKDSDFFRYLANSCLTANLKEEIQIKAEIRYVANEPKAVYAIVYQDSGCKHKYSKDNMGDCPVWVEAENENGKKVFNKDAQNDFLFNELKNAIEVHYPPRPEYQTNNAVATENRPDLSPEFGGADDDLPF